MVDSWNSRPATPAGSNATATRDTHTPRSPRATAGHRLRAEIASSAFPKFDINLGTGGDRITETTGVTAINRL